MSSRTPQQERAFKTRQTILTAARTLVRTLGIERLSLDRVCREAGVSKGALMYHFPNKNALVEGMIADYAEHLRSNQCRHETEAAQTAVKGQDASLLMHGYVAWHRAFVERNPLWRDVGVRILSCCAQGDDMTPLRDWYASVFTRIEALPQSQRIEVLNAVAAMEGYFFMSKFGLDVVDPELKNAALQDLVRRIDEMCGQQ